METLPRDIDSVIALSEICRRYHRGRGICYLDLWPFSDTMILVSSPTLAQQANLTNPVLAKERPPAIVDYMRPITGGPNVFDMPEAEWRPWRAAMNKSFSAANALSLVPSIVDECLTFRSTLLHQARQGRLFYLHPITRRLAFDNVGHLIL
jgi:cytochrome P450